MKKLIVITTLIIAFAAWPVSAYADQCDDIAQGYQSSINAQTQATTTELAARGIDINSPEGQQQLQTALQPIEAQINLQVSACKLQMTRINDGLTNNQGGVPASNNSAPVVINGSAVSTLQPTNSPQVTQFVITATLTPTVMAHPNYKPAFVQHYTPSPTISPTSTPSATPTPTKKPILKTHQQKHNVFQNIAQFFQNLFHFIHWL
jgi:hypothetical protein